MKPFRKIRSSIPELNLVQEAVDEVFRSLSLEGFIDGVLLTGQAITPIETVITHGLQRQPRGWVVVDSTGGAIFYRYAWSTTTLTLVASTNTTASIWVF